ncbi:MAG: hypothetical protein ACRD4K_12925, partial [Candidatus Acidiferrales bacterium]
RRVSRVKVQRLDRAGETAAAISAAPPVAAKPAEIAEGQGDRRSARQEEGSKATRAKSRSQS